MERLPPTMLDEYEELIQRFLYEVEMETYLNAAGLREVVNTAAIFERYAGLFTEQRVRTLKNASQNLDGEEKERARRLYAVACENYLENAVKTLTDKLHTQEATEKVVTDEGKEATFRFLSTLIQNEQDRTRRKKLYELELSVVKTLNAYHEPIIKAFHEKARELGYANYLDMYKDLRHTDICAIRDIMSGFLKRTEDIYVELMNALLAKYSLDLDKLERHDISYIFAGSQYDKYFPSSDMLNVISAFTASLGMDITKLRGKERNVILDVEHRPTKSPRAFVSAVDPPFEIYLVVMPQGGVSDYFTIFHETGHALHYAFELDTLPFVYKKLGSSAVSESYAFLLEYVLTNPGFASKFIPDNVLEEYIRFEMLNKLYMLRRYAGKLNYEIILHTSNELEKMPEIYAEEMKKALLFKHPPELFLADIDNGFYTAEYLRAWIFEPMLRNKLIELYGENWFSNPDAGRYLRALWSVGEKHDVEELAKNINMEALNTKYLEEEFLNL